MDTDAKLLTWERPAWNLKRTIEVNALDQPLFELMATHRNDWTLVSRLGEHEEYPHLRNANEGVAIANQMWFRHVRAVAALGQHACVCGAKARWRFTIRGLTGTTEHLCCPNHVNTTLQYLIGKRMKLEEVTW